MLDVTLAPPQRHRSLTVFPLLARNAPDLPYSLMSDALRHGTLRITEVGWGSVPEVLALNAGESAVLVLDGEQLVGARQNRTTSRSLLLAPKSETNIPVSCMEQGRWHFAGVQFAPTFANCPPVVRRQAREVEAERARAGEAAPASTLAMAQGRVWAAIADQSNALGTRSETGALNDLYAHRAVDLEGWAAEYRPEPDQVGLLAFLGGSPLGLDLLGSPRLYAPLHDRLVRGYVMDALGSRARARSVSLTSSQTFLDRVGAAHRVESPTVGIGSYAVLSGTVIGGELKDEGRIVHLSAFPSTRRRSGGPGAGTAGDPIAPPSRRRRRS